MKDTGRYGGQQVPVVKYEPTSRRGEALAPRGSVVVYLAAAGSEQLTAIRDHGAGRAAELSMAGIDQIDPDGQPATLTYGDRVLAEGVAVPRDGRAVRLVLPYTGGELDASQLLVSSGEGEQAIDAVAVRYDPALSAVEQAALTLIPRDQLTVNLGAALAGGIALDNEEERRRQQEEQQRAAEEARMEQAMAAAEARADAAEARHDARGGGDPSRFDVHLLDITAQTISPVQSAIAMLEIRRELLQGQLEHG